MFGIANIIYMKKIPAVKGNCGVYDLLFCPAGNRILYNRKRADESDAAASKQGDTASPEKRGFPVFSGATTAKGFAFVCEKKFHFFFQESEGNGEQGGSGFLFRWQSASPGVAGAGALPENCGKPKTFPQGETIEDRPFTGQKNRRFSWTLVNFDCLFCLDRV